jgi:hypothetical protein
MSTTGMGIGTFNLDFTNKTSILGFTFEFYTGHGTIGGVNYDFYATYETSSGGLTITIFPAGADPNISTDWIDFNDGIYVSGSPVTGTYVGNPGSIYNGVNGNFTATKQ